METYRLKMGLRGLNVSDLLIRCKKITSDMGKDASTFDAPVPTLDIVKATIGQLSVLQQQMGSGSTNTKLRNECKDKLLRQMRQLADYVSLVAQGDAKIILRSGFDIIRESKAIGELPPPTGIFVTTDKLNLGELLVMWKGVPGNRGYVIGIALMENGQPGPWTTVVPKRLKHLFKGLISGAQYAIRIRTQSSAGEGTWSHTRHYRPQ